MNVPDRLAAALEGRANDSHVTPDALDRIRTRVRARRRAQRIRVAGAATAAAAIVVATPALLQRVEKAGFTPPASSGGPSAPGRTIAPWRAESQFAVVTADRTLALVSAKTGEITRRITTFDRMPWSVDISLGDKVLVVLPPKNGDGCGQIVEVDVATRKRRTRTMGYAAAYEDSRDITLIDCAHNLVATGPHGSRVTITNPGGDEGARFGSVTVSHSRHYVQEYGDDSNDMYRFFPPADRTRADGDRMVTTYFASMNVPVPWKDRLLQTDSAQLTPGRSEVRALRTYTKDGYAGDYDVLFTVPHGIDGLAVGWHDEVVVSAGGSFWLWTGKGEARRIGKAYPVFAW